MVVGAENWSLMNSICGALINDCGKKQ